MITVPPPRVAADSATEIKTTVSVISNPDRGGDHTMTRTERGGVTVAQERATISFSASPLADLRASTAATPTEVESR